MDRLFASLMNVKVRVKPEVEEFVQSFLINDAKVIHGFDLVTVKTCISRVGDFQRLF